MKGFESLMTILFEVTREGLSEKSRSRHGRFTLPRAGVAWFLIRPDGPEWDIASEGLPVDDTTLQWIASPDRRPTFRVKGNLALVDFAVYNAANEGKQEYVRYVIGKDLLITIDSAATGTLDAIPGAIREIAFPFRPVVEDILYNVVNVVLATHAEGAVHVRKFVNDLALKLDNDSSSVEVKDILRAKTRLAHFSHVLEEQLITLGFTPNVRWRGRSDRVRVEFGSLRESLRTLEASMENTRNRLDTIHHQYELVLQEASNKRLNVLTIVQAIFVPLTFLAGIFGMNFTYMPGLEWRYGYFASLALMVAITTYSVRYFIRHGWFE
jgi:magnesium transporter